MTLRSDSLRQHRMLAADQLATELLSFHANLPSGSAIILIEVLIYVLSIYVLSIALGPFGGLFWLVFPRRHLEA